MKNNTILSYISLCLILLSCSTQDLSEPQLINPEQPQSENPFSAENPLSNFLSITGYNELQVLSCDLESFEEIGLQFKVLEKGVINSLKVKIPIVNNNLVVTITDVASNDILRVENLNIAVANQEIIKTIVPIELKKNKIYTITIKTNLHYKRFRADNSQPPFPVTVGNIKIITPISTEFSLDGQSLRGTGNFYSGDCDFTFLRTE